MFFCLIHSESIMVSLKSIDLFCSPCQSFFLQLQHALQDDCLPSRPTPLCNMRGLQESWDAYLRVPLDASARQVRRMRESHDRPVVIRCFRDLKDSICRDATLIIFITSCFTNTRAAKPYNRPELCTFKLKLLYQFIMVIIFNS